ncbi:hypothetical protein Nepgr_029835 [Nepenthes gracilis]|uniref:Uncharacterized protein n=1 Tax=Nepenthes gracilis TaxID=150966 RepID=A0AAD3TG25_NEPGR|nr:hypothetical protein Nepgr_029835 [Nepenthes gracilis]
MEGCEVSSPPWKLGFLPNFLGVLSWPQCCPRPGGLDSGDFHQGMLCASELVRSANHRRLQSWGSHVDHIRQAHLGHGIGAYRVSHRSLPSSFS